MCLDIKNSLHTTKFGLKNPYIASKNKVVYKAILEEEPGQYITPFMGVKLEFDSDGAAVQITDGDLEIKGSLYNGYRVEKGVHGFKSEKAAQKYMHLVVCSISQPAAQYLEEHTKICKAIIPKGEKFYYGTRGDIVATKMIVYEPKEHEE